MDGRKGSNPGTLQISGQIFIDGDLDVSGNAHYTGHGEIYANGSVTSTSNVYICGPKADGSALADDCSGGTWSPATGSLYIFAVNSANVSPGIKINGGGVYDIDAYVNGEYDNHGGANVMGSVIADGGVLGGNGAVIIPNVAPQGSPVIWQLKQGQWLQLK